MPQSNRKNFHTHMYRVRLLFYPQSYLASKLLYKNRLLSFYSKIQMFTIVFAVNRSTFTIINFPCIFSFTNRQLRVHLFGKLHLNGLSEKSYLSSRINDPLFVCGIQPLQQKLFVKAAVSQFVPFSLSSITLHKLICATTLPFSVS